MRPEGSPYRAQELRPPKVPPRPWSPPIASVVVLLIGIACFVVCCFPHAPLFTYGALLGGVVAVTKGLHALTRRGAGQSFPWWWSGAAWTVMGTLLLTAPTSTLCAERREGQIIAAVHAWRTAHGRYPASLRELHLEPPAICRFAWKRDDGFSGRIRYVHFPGEDDAMLVRTLLVFMRRTYGFRSRRFGFID